MNTASMAEALRMLADCTLAKQAPSIAASARQALRLVDSRYAHRTL
jgi:hypothetical protein